MSSVETSVNTLKPMGDKQNGSIIPSDWTISPLRKVAPLQRGFDLPKSHIRSGPYPVVYSNGVIEHHNQSMVKGPGVVTGRSGTIGNVHFVEGDYWPHNTSLWVTSFCGNDPKFIYYLYIYTNLGRLLSGSGVPTLNRNDVHQHTVALPPISEQRAIAEALSDVDGLLTKLDALIAKKRAIKQAAMQQLLTGKTRLPGFCGEWETKRLGDMGRCLRGVSYDPTTDLSSHDSDSTVRLLRSNNIQNAVVTATDVQYVEARRVSESQVMHPNDILVCMANGSKELVGKAGLFRTKDGYAYTFGSFMGCFRIERTIADSSFVFYLFQTCEFRDLVGLILAGSSINNLKPSNIESAEFQIPDRNEQRAVAAVLSDIDGEIVALERRRDKTHAIKHGMMRQLLTGRVRLVAPDLDKSRS